MFCVRQRSSRLLRLTSAAVHGSSSRPVFPVCAGPSSSTPLIGFKLYARACQRSARCGLRQQQRLRPRPLRWASAAAASSSLAACVNVLPAGPPPPLQASQLLLRRRLRWTSLRLDLNVVFEMFLDLEMILSPETFLDPVMILVPRWTSSTIGPIYVAVECRWTASPKTRIAATAS